MTERWYPLSTPTIGDDEVEAACEVLRSRHTTSGYKVEQFEQKFAAKVGSTFGIMVNSGSSADLLMAMAHPADERHWPGKSEVVISAVTWPTHVWSFVTAGYKVRFADVDGLNTTSRTIADTINPHTEAVSLVHLMGIPAEVPDCGGITVTEDCCEALGAKPVGRSLANSWSFFFSHHITTMEGGMITTRDRALAEKLRSMRSHGWSRGIRQHDCDTDPRYRFTNPGFNVRATEVAAAIGLVQLARLDDFNAAREKNRRIFAEALEGCPGIEIPQAPEGSTPAWFGLPFFADNRDGLKAYLESSGVETRPILGGNLLRQPAFKDWPKQNLPGADRVHDHGLYVGLHPVSDSGVERVAELIGEFCG